MLSAGIKNSVFACVGCRLSFYVNTRLRQRIDVIACCLTVAKAIGVALCINLAQVSAVELVDNSPLPSQLQQSEHGQIFDEAVHILGGNVNVISQWTGQIRLVVVGDAENDATAGSADSSGATDNEDQTSAAVHAGNVIAEIAELTGLQIAPASDRYASAADYLQSIKRAARFSLSDCSDVPGSNSTGSKSPGSNSTGSDNSAAGASGASIASDDQTSNSNTIPDSASHDGAMCGNFFVVIADLAEMEAIARAIPLRPVYQKAFAKPDAVKCFFSPFQSGYMEIRQALVFVRSDLSQAMVRTCLQEEIYQSFGMFNDYTGSKYYSFNNKIEPKVITRYDRALLQTIYDPGFRQGAPVFMVVKKLMERLGLDPFANGG